MALFLKRPKNGKKLKIGRIPIKVKKKGRKLAVLPPFPVLAQGEGPDCSLPGGGYPLGGSAIGVADPPLGGGSELLNGRYPLGGSELLEGGGGTPGVPY